MDPGRRVMNEGSNVTDVGGLDDSEMLREVVTACAKLMDAWDGCPTNTDASTWRTGADPMKNA